MAKSFVILNTAMENENTNFANTLIPFLRSFLTCSLENSSFKQVFLENYREDHEKVFKRDSAIGVFLRNFQKFSEQQFYGSTKRRLLRKIQAVKKSRTQTDALG